MSQPDCPAPLNPNAPHTPEYEYAYYFPEGTGYLYVDHLGRGQDGTVDIVWSCEEAIREETLRQAQANVNGTDPDRSSPPNHDEDLVSKFLVRKKTKPALPRADELDPERVPATLPEIRNARRHHRIPDLREWTEYHPLPAEHQHHLTLTSVAMIFQYCNGGTLHSCLHKYAEFDRVNRTLQPSQGRIVYIPEPFIWRVLGQILDVANWLHHQRPGIYHADIHLGNVFLHFSHDRPMPDCFLGDFGRSEIMYSRSWDVNGFASYSAADPRLSEYKDLLLIIKELMTLRDSASMSGGIDETEERYRHMRTNTMHYTRFLYNQISRIEHQVADAELDHSNPDFSEMARNIISYSDAAIFLERSSLRNINRQWGLQPMTFSSCNELLAQPQDERPAGPWKVAKIRTDNKAVVALSREVYRTYEPWTLLSTSQYYGHVRGENSHSIPRSDRDISVSRL